MASTCHDPRSTRHQVHLGGFVQLPRKHCGVHPPPSSFLQILTKSPSNLTRSLPSFRAGTVPPKSSYGALVVRLVPPQRPPPRESRQETLQKKPKPSMTPIPPPFPTPFSYPAADQLALQSLAGTASQPSNRHPGVGRVSARQFGEPLCRKGRRNGELGRIHGIAF